MVIFEMLDVQVKGGGLDAAGAEETPIVDGDEFDEGVLASVGGGIVVDEGLAKLLVGVGGFVREDGGIGGDAVFQALNFTLDFPSVVVGPVDFWAFRRFASICFSVAMMACSFGK